MNKMNEAAIHSHKYLEFSLMWKTSVFVQCSEFSLTSDDYQWIEVSSSMT